jgi:uncharacterized protein (DUF1015 family)
MTKIFAFKGITYNKSMVGDYSKILTQPYDKIDDEMQDIYYRKHKYNHVRITKGKSFKGDSETNNKYTRSAGYLNEWLKKGILKQDLRATIYAYYQEYEAEGEKKVRKGFIALGKLVELGKGGVHPHERTLLGPKVDRLSMMRQVGGSTGQIFMLYSDPKLIVNKITDSFAKRKPDIVSRDEYNVVHKVWKIQNPVAIKKVAKVLANKDVFIADGHHRYETALNYRNEMVAKKVKSYEPESYNNRMMTFVNMDDVKGLTVLPTHRLIFGLKSFSFINFQKKLIKYFKIKEFPYFTPADEKIVRHDFINSLKHMGQRKHCIGLVAKGLNKYTLLVLRDEKIMQKVVKEKHSDDWKKLDVTVLHSLVLETLLGISRESVAKEENLHYIRGEDAAIEVVNPAPQGRRAGDGYQMVFLLNPTKVDEVRKIAGRSERMPQKSTDFFPKLLSGVVISKVNYGK